jgi:RND family efflux transporter MFP subunit
MLCIIAAVGFGVARARQGANPDATASALPAAPSVAVVPVTRRNLSQKITLTAELTPYNVANVYAKVSGYLSSISVDYGSHVHAGETLATLQLPEQQADLERAQSAYTLAKISYDRILSVVHANPGILAQQDVDNARAAYESARDERNRAQVMLDYTTITAPFDGIVTKRNVDIGDLISQGENGSATKPLLEIADDSRLRLVIETPESVVPFIQVGTPVDVRIQGTNQSIAATISRFSYDVHEDTRTMHTEVDIANSDLRLKPGMYADVTITLSRHDNVIAVPTQAVATEGNPNVWIVDRNDQLRERPVTVGIQTPNWVEVDRGLEVGDRVFVGSRTMETIGERVAPRVVTPATGA